MAVSPKIWEPNRDRGADFIRVQMPIKEKRHVEVYWETHEITKVSFVRNHSATVFCQTCLADTLHLSVSEAASILRLSEFAIFRFAEINQIHTNETEGPIQICGKSLSALERDRQAEK